MITIDMIRICRYRSIADLQMPLSPHCVLFGENNCGKTTVLTALELALSDSTRVCLDDFHRADQAHEPAQDFFIDVRFIPINEHHERVSQFSAAWTSVFGHNIVHDHHARQYFALRTRFTRDSETGLIEKTRSLIVNWGHKHVSDTPVELPENIQWVFLDDQNNLCCALNTEGSFLNRAIESMQRDLAAHPEFLNTPTEDIREILNRLSQALQGPGATIPDDFALTPASIGEFFKSVKNQEGPAARMAALQGHGSLKSSFILATLTMIEALYRQAQAHNQPLFVMVGAEEPETHLHPNAQRSLMQQLLVQPDQLLVSTHSPYISAMCEPNEYRSLIRNGQHIDVRWLPRHMDPADVRVLKRLILRFKGEALFARGLIFVEGVTEEQLIRGMFHAYFGNDPSLFGISIIGVDGKSYSPYLLLAMSLRKPFCIVSDNDGDSYYVVRKQMHDIEKKLDYSCEDNMSEAFFLSPGLAMEGELVYKTNLHREIIDSLMACTSSDTMAARSRTLKRKSLMQASPRELKRRLEKKKSEYSGFLGSLIEENPYGQPLANMTPKAVQGALLLVERWLNEQMSVS